MEKDIKRIIFDLDETLFNTKNDANRAYQLFLESHDFNCTSEQLYDAIGDLLYVDELSIDIFYEFLKKYLGKNFTREDFAEFQKIYINEVTLINEKTKDVLKYLSEKYELVVLTNWFYKLQAGKLKKLDLFKYFTEIFTVDNLGKKPEIEVYKKACGSHLLNECTIIGDNLQWDVLIPRKIGMNSIYFGNSKEIDSITDLTQLMDIL